MATVPSRLRVTDNGYPTWSADPMPESDWHRKLMNLVIEMLVGHFAGRQVYVTGNMLVFYEPGDGHRHISPDVWVARGVEVYDRLNYLIWEEPCGPEFVIELTSSSTATSDQTTKFELYRDVLRVREYFLFDPYGDYLDPQLQGYRLRGGAYQVIHPRNGRLPSQVTGLHLEADGINLRLWNPQTQAWLLSEAELRAQAEDRADQEQEQREEAQERAEEAQERADQAEAALEKEKQRSEQLTAENLRLRRLFNLPDES